MTKEKYHDALNNLAATVGMGWHERPQRGDHYMLWADAKDAARCACKFWNPLLLDHQLVMLLAKVLDSGKAYHLALDSCHLVADRAWVATIRGIKRGAFQPDKDSWRVALVKACIVICGGELPEEPDDKEEKA